ncbi:MAG: hypothetical protein AB1698_11385 [Pseudomonadota bacterium]
MAPRRAPGADTPVPPFRLRAFFATGHSREAVAQALRDPRLRRLDVGLSDGGIAAAVAALPGGAPPPDALLVELAPDSADPMAELERLAAVCRSPTRVFVVGHSNDVRLYQRVVREGARDYLLAPLSPQDVADCLVRDLVSAAADRHEGECILVMGTRGGAGATTVATNLAFLLATTFMRRTALADLCHPFGAVAAHMDAIPVREAADYFYAPEDLDHDVMDRLLVRKAPNLDLLLAEGGLERAARADGQLPLERIIALLRASHDRVVCDLPLVWTRALEVELARAADVVLVMPPDFAGAAHAQALVKRLAVLRGERRPFLVLNQAGMARRQELSRGDLGRILGCAPDDLTVIGHDARAFSQSEQAGQVLCERAPRHPAARALADLAARISGEAPSPSRGRLSGTRLRLALSALRQRFA